MSGAAVFFTVLSYRIKKISYFFMTSDKTYSLNICQFFLHKENTLLNYFITLYISAAIEKWVDLPRSIF